MRRPLAGTGWKMNIGAAETARYAERLVPLLASTDAVDIFVLPPFTSLHAARVAFAGSPVAYGGQNMHWDEAGAWTGEVSAPMLAEAGCRYVELAHSERLAHFGETYPLAGRKLDRALAHGLTPILCLGETADDKRAGRTDAILFEQLGTALANQPPERVPHVVLAYEPRWAIGAADAASPDYVAERHAALRAYLRHACGANAAEATRIIYGGSVNAANGPALAALDDVDGLFIGRAAWTPEGFAALVTIVARAAADKEERP
jgi:triosephosphate isomerase